MRRLPLAIALLMLAFAATAQVYKWTDAQGTVHYTQMPPAKGVKFTKIKSAGGEQAAAASTDMANPAADYSSETEPAEASTAPIPDTPKNRASMCESLKTSLDALRGSAPVVMQQEGKSQVLSGAQRETQLTQAQARYAQYCSQ